jgi:hypothetical protein
LVREGTVSGGDISTGGVNLWSKMKRKNRGMKTGGASPREIPFSIDVKGGEIETLMRSDDHRGSMSMSVSMSKCFHQCWCFHQCQRGRLLDNWFGQLVVIDVNPWRVILEIDVNP